MLDPDALEYLANNKALLEIARKKIEDNLVMFRDRRISLMGRNNGLVIRDRDGRDSDIIRMSAEEAVRVGLKAIAEHLRSEAQL